MLNRAIEWNRDGIRIEADQKHVREILSSPELERANHIVTPFAVDKQDEDGARDDESKGESRRGRRQTQTKHERDRPQMADDDASDSQAVTGGDITRYRVLVA